MVKSKFRSKYGYSGRRKNRKLATRKGLQESDDSAVKAGPDACKSSSARKFDLFGIDMGQLSKPPVRDESPDCYFIIQFACLSMLLKSLACPLCLKSNVLEALLIDKEHCGFSYKIKVQCTDCGKEILSMFLCQRVGSATSSRTPFDINLRAVLAFRGIGCGFSSMKDWCGTMNFPNSFAYGTFSSHQNKLELASKSVFDKMSEQSHESIRAAYKEIGIVPDDQGVLDIAVSYDGTWQKRGHSSHNGIGCAIELLTGLPIDYEVLSNFCLKCKITSEDPSTTDEWKAAHADNCPRNFTGTANAMEVEAVKRIWQRSVEKHKFRYTTILSDGDSKSFLALAESNMYGDIAIHKEECVNHVSKRMGTALRNLIDDCKSRKESISGKGKLTAVKITKIQNYYGRAIKDHCNDIELMKKRIYAILFHMSSSHLFPKHHHCPPGEKSWCFWQRAIAKGSTPGSHSEHETLSPDVGQKLVPIFRRLTEENLLKRCTRNRTQNPNESLHNIIWRLCPKSTFVGRRTVETAATLAICQFSMGASFRKVLCEIIGTEMGSYSEEFVRKKSLKRLKKAYNASTEEVKRRRRQLKYRTVASSQKLKDLEGSTYSDGSF